MNRFRTSLGWGLALFLLAGCQKNFPAAGRLLPGTADVILDEKNPADSLYPSPNGKSLLYFSDHHSTVLINLDQLTKQESRNFLAYSAPFRVWREDSQKFMFAQPGPASNPGAAPDEFVNEDFVDRIAKRSFERQTSFYWDPDRISEWLSVIVAKLELYIPHLNVTTKDDIAVFYAQLLLGSDLAGIVYESQPRLSPEIQGLSASLHTHDPLQQARIFKYNEAVLWNIYPKDIVTGVLLSMNRTALSLLEMVRATLGVTVLNETDYVFTHAEKTTIVFKRRSLGQNQLDLQMFRIMDKLPLPLVHYAPDQDHQTVDIGHFWPSPDGSCVLYTLKGLKQTKDALQPYSDLYLLRGLDLPQGENVRSKKIAEDVLNTAAWSSNSQTFWYAKAGQGLYEVPLKPLSTRDQASQLKQADLAQRKIAGEKIIVGRIVYLSRGSDYISVSLLLDGNHPGNLQIPLEGRDELKRALEEADPDHTGDFPKLINRSMKVINPQEVNPVKFPVESMGAGIREKLIQLNAAGGVQIIPGPNTTISIE